MGFEEFPQGENKKWVTVDESGTPVNKESLEKQDKEWVTVDKSGTPVSKDFSEK
jgi:hypothetical protein